MINLSLFIITDLFLLQYEIVALITNTYLNVRINSCNKKIWKQYRWLHIRTFLNQSNNNMFK